MKKTALDVALTLFVACVVAGCSSSRAVDAPSSATPKLAGSACGNAGPRVAPWQHVIWIWFENRSFDQVIGSRGSQAFKNHPYLNEVASRCGLMTRFSAVQRASLANYIAATTGSASGIRGGCAPSDCPIHRDNIFERVRDGGMEWRSYQESMPKPCTRANAGRFVARHDPALYLTSLRAECPSWDVPLGSPQHGEFARALDEGDLPAFALVTPNLCNSGHDCSDRSSDQWLEIWLGRIVNSTAWSANDVAVIITWDEGDRKAVPGLSVNDPCPRTGAIGQDCHVATVIVAPSIPEASQVDVRADHRALLDLTLLILGLDSGLGDSEQEATRIAEQLRLLPTSSSP